MRDCRVNMYMETKMKRIETGTTGGTGLHLQN
jgi:hypothetical protein